MIFYRSEYDEHGLEESFQKRGGAKDKSNSEESKAARIVG